MKAMLLDENRNFVWSEVPTPAPESNQVLIEIHACALNRADLLQRAGTYPSPKGWPEWMGLELAGKIVGMGDEAKEKCSLKMGADVCALVGGGAYAEYIAVDYRLVMAMPEGMSYEEASSLPEAYATSYLNLFYEAHLTSGQTAYISAGASGLASAAIPLAKAFGAKVVTSIIDEDKRADVEKLGADIIVNTKTESLEEVFKALDEKGEPVGVAMDCVAGEDLGKALSYMAEGGYWVLISTLGGVETKIMLRPVLTRGLHLVGSMLRKRTNDFKAELLGNLTSKVWPMFTSGQLKTSVYKVLPITEAEKAHNILKNNENTGKVVLTVR